LTHTVPRLLHTARAQEDLIEVWLFVAQHNQSAADALLDGIDLIRYRIITDGVEIVRVLHGARHLPDLI